MLDAGVQLASDEGIYAAPEGAACVAALRETAGLRIPEAHRPHRAVQHRLGPEVSRSVLHALPAHRLQRAGQAGRPDHAAMKDLALQRAGRGGAARRHLRRCPRHRNRASAKSPPRTARPGTFPAPNRMGIGIRVLAFGCWGFAATDDLTSEGIEAAAALALEIARAGTAARKQRGLAGAGGEVRGHLGLARPHRPVLHSGGPQSGGAAGGGRGAAPQPGHQPGRSLDALRAAAAGFRLHAGQPHRPDALPLAARDFRR